MSDLAARILRVKRSGIWQKTIAAVAGVDAMTIKNVVHQHHPPTPESVDRLEEALDEIEGPLCQHLDCREVATVRFTWPEPIARWEVACNDHSETLMDTVLPGLEVEYLGEK